MSLSPQAAFRWMAAPGTGEHAGELPGSGGFTVRRARPGDEPALAALLERVGPEAIRLRFFGPIRHFSHRLLSTLARSDDARHLSLVVLRAGPAGTQIVANAMLVVTSDGTAAEFAVLVHRDYTQHGLGRHLIECLLQHAQCQGISKVYGLVLRDNPAMLKLAEEMGFTQDLERDMPECVRIEYDTRMP